MVDPRGRASRRNDEPHAPPLRRDRGAEPHPRRCERLPLGCGRAASDRRTFRPRVRRSRYGDRKVLEKRTAQILVVDLDDTLWTWFDAWYLSFSEFLSTTSALSGIAEIDLKRAIRPIHQRHPTSEYSWLLDELDELNQKVPTGVTVAEFFDPALHAQNRARKEATQLYPGVRDTLTRLRAGGTTVVAYTESLAFWTRWRIQQTGLRPAAVPVLAPVGSRSGWDLLHKARAHWGSANARSNDHDVRVWARRYGADSNSGCVRSPWPRQRRSCRGERSLVASAPVYPGSMMAVSSTLHPRPPIGTRGLSLTTTSPARCNVSSAKLSGTPLSWRRSVSTDDPDDSRPKHLSGEVAANADDEGRAGVSEQAC